LPFTLYGNRAHFGADGTISHRPNALMLPAAFLDKKTGNADNWVPADRGPLILHAAVFRTRGGTSAEFDSDLLTGK